MSHDQHQRAVEMARLYRSGMSMSQVGAAMGISRERVRQLLRQHLPDDLELTQHSRQRRAEATVRQRRALLLQRSQRWAKGRLAFQAQELDAAVRPYKDDASWLHAQFADRLVRSGSGTGEVYSDEDLVDFLRQASTRLHGHLSVSAYDRLREPEWPSAALIVHRLGWRNALQRAGLFVPVPRRTYTRRWSEQDLITWVRAFRDEVPGGTSVQYESWQRTRSAAPSLTTVSNALGGWRSALTQALKL